MRNENNTKIKNARLKMGLTQAGLEKKSGISGSVIKALEQGARDVDKAQIKTLIALCAALDCKVSSVLNDPELIALMQKCEAAIEVQGGI